MNKLEQFTAFLTVYAELYRNRYELAVDEPITTKFFTKDIQIVVTISDVEPTPQQDVIWWDGTSLKKTVAPAATGNDRYLTVVHSGTATGTISYANLFPSSIVHIGEHIDTGLTKEKQPIFTQQNIGSLLVSNGVEYVSFLRGSDGYSIVADSTSEIGLRWQPTGIDDGDISWKGDWGSTVAYRTGDVVKHDDYTYIAIASNQEKEPPYAAYWSDFIGRGEPGMPGPQGPQGPQGVPGLKWEGKWVSGTYAEGSAVTYGGSTYRASLETSETPPHNDWELVSGGIGHNVKHNFTVSQTGDSIQAGRIVIVNDDGQIEYAFSTTASHRYRVVGLTAQAGDPGQLVQVILSGIVFGSDINPGTPIWNWVLGTPLFIGSNGLLTQESSQVGVTRAFNMIVGIPIAPNTIKLDFYQPYIV